jgi:hypothetical protein
VEFILHSPQKAGNVPKPPRLKISRPYTPEVLLKNVNALGIRCIDDNDKEGIQKFFKKVGRIQRLIQERDKTFETTLGFIPGYDNVLKAWVPEFAMGEIPSPKAVFILKDKVRFPLYIFSFTC